MERLLIILVFLGSTVCVAQPKPVTIDDLLTLSSLSPKNFNTYLGKKGFIPTFKAVDGNNQAVTFIETNNGKRADSLSFSRSIEMYKRDDSYYFALHTSSQEEFQEGRSRLKQAGFFYDNTNRKERPSSLSFKKGGITIMADTSIREQGVVYSFLLQKKEFPDPGAIRFAEDLLKFDSHEHLVHFFGERSVKKDVYLFSETESKQCSVLFPNSNRQAVFIWEDDRNLHKVSFIVIGGVLPTTATVQYDRSIGQNTWTLENGVYSGMRIKDLLKINGNDFKFFGQDSEFSFMVEPVNTRYLDFKRIGIVLGCFDCSRSPLLKTEKVSAEEAADLDLALYVSSVMLRPR